ncbi:DUF3899 domain-containing protein [Bacillus aerolatus]|uniref:DUF3899 domain-containing protein n=1 Tax=Bacillus aerolatus TaxID=2653354 RepID=A0A6I1FHN2_9BACI|nr:DUF3899 domain-containing protein [Bacillus aerolatus]KAB7704987.1 DUF3899 domain-containing protein [Bacillus aerolatus]
MKLIQKSFMISGIIIISSAVFSLFSSIFFKNFLDYAFLFSLLCVTAGACLFVIEGGFFSGISYSFKNFRKSTKEGRYIAEFDHLDKTGNIHEEHAKKKRFKWTYPLLAGGGLILIATFVIALTSSS